MEAHIFNADNMMIAEIQALTDAVQKCEDTASTNSILTGVLLAVVIITAHYA